MVRKKNIGIDMAKSKKDLDALGKSFFDSMQDAVWSGVVTSTPTGILDPKKNILKKSQWLQSNPLTPNEVFKPQQKTIKKYDIIEMLEMAIMAGQEDLSLNQRQIEKLARKIFNERKKN